MTPIHKMIAETDFKVGLEAIDTAPQSRRRVETLHRLHEAAYTAWLVTARLHCASDPKCPCDGFAITGSGDESAISQSSQRCMSCHPFAVYHNKKLGLSTFEQIIERWASQESFHSFND